MLYKHAANNHSLKYTNSKSRCISFVRYKINDHVNHNYAILYAVYDDEFSVVNLKQKLNRPPILLEILQHSKFHKKIASSQLLGLNTEEKNSIQNCATQTANTKRQYHQKTLPPKIRSSGHISRLKVISCNSTEKNVKQIHSIISLF
jgi:hypothetical protein